MATAMNAQGVMAITDIHYVPYGNARENPDKTFSCQHGAPECKGNMIEACAIYAYPDQTKSWPFLVCMERGNPPNDGQKCATQTGLDWTTINNCYNNASLSYSIMHGHAQDTQRLQPPHQYTPWITLNGKPLYQDFSNMLRKICAAYTGTKPPGCNAEVEEDITVCVRDD